jgi:hypothetical protein
MVSNENTRRGLGDSNWEQFENNAVSHQLLLHAIGESIRSVSLVGVAFISQSAPYEHG